MTVKDFMETEAAAFYFNNNFKENKDIPVYEIVKREKDKLITLFKGTFEVINDDSLFNEEFYKIETVHRDKGGYVAVPCEVQRDGFITEWIDDIEVWTRLYVKDEAEAPEYEVVVTFPAKTEEWQECYTGFDIVYFKDNLYVRENKEIKTNRFANKEISLQFLCIMEDKGRPYEAKKATVYNRKIWYRCVNKAMRMVPHFPTTEDYIREYWDTRLKELKTLINYN